MVRMPQVAYKQSLVWLSVGIILAPSSSELLSISCSVCCQHILGGRGPSGRAGFGGALWRLARRSGGRRQSALFDLDSVKP